MEKYYLAALNLIGGCGNKQVRVLVNYFKSAENIWRSSAQELLSCRFLSASAVQELLTLKEQGVPENLARVCEQQHIKIINYLDPDYPENLREITNFPTSLFYKGRPLKDIQNPLGIVGPRKSTDYAKDVVRFFVGEFASYELSIISGGARGIDTIAHQTALKSGLHTVAVMGCGLDITYPPENGKLFAEIAERGTLLSEYLPGVKPLGRHFPARNRIISGLSQGVLLPEAGQRSGSLITAEFALEQGREVYCVPGSIFSANSFGVHSLIKQGAKLTSMPVDILEDYYPQRQFERETIARPAAEAKQTTLLEAPELNQAAQMLSAEQQQILNILQYDVLMSMEEVHLDCSLDIGTLNLVLLELEIMGYLHMDISQRKYLKVRGVG